MKRIKRIKKRISFQNRFLKLITIIILILLSTFLMLLYGPYNGFRNWLVTTAMTTMNHQYLATTFYTNKTINKILEENKIIEPSTTTDLSLINTLKIKTTIYKNQYEKDLLEHDSNAIYKLINIKEKNFTGYLTAIYDPAKIKLVTSKNLGVSGEYLVNMANRENAIVAINGGGFVDDTTLNSGGVPDGILIKDGQILNSKHYSKSGGVIGFTKDNKLYLGKVSAQEAINIGVRDAVEFGPFLIINGEVSKVVGNGGYGLHPRTVIGQRKDGIVLFLVIDGRSTTSVGADMDALIEIMERYGAYNAANLDGGNSSALVINNKIVNHPINWSNQEETRPIADGFIVTK
jgi:exopolysaccharide biosynthesis protein